MIGQNEVIDLREDISWEEFLSTPEPEEKKENTVVLKVGVNRRHKSHTHDSKFSILEVNDVTVALKGGSGSGNFGHEGRPGEVGGSSPSEGSWVHSPSNNQAIDIKASAKEFKGIVKSKIGVNFSVGSYRYGGMFGERNCRITFTGADLKEEHVPVVRELAKEYFGILLKNVDDNTYYPTPDITIWFDQMTPEGKKRWNDVINNMGKPK